MACLMKSRKDDIFKKDAKEKSWVCEKCKLLLFARKKPVCRAVMLAKVKALHAFAEANDLNEGKQT